MVDHDGELLLCGTCMEARGLDDAGLVDGAQRSTMATLAERTLACDRVADILTKLMRRPCLSRGCGVDGWFSIYLA